MQKKALSLLSGGLDSLLATKIILEQQIEVVGLHFTSPFCNGIKGERGDQAARAAAELRIRLIVKDKGPGYVDVVTNPAHGYGKNMNPCIDCRIYMLKAAAEVMRAEGASFIVTGEVLGQRPMSQRRDTIRLIEKQSGLEGLIVRPLSAKLFSLSVPESEGIVDRGRLLAITGRSRKSQYQLTETYGLKEFGCPAGGCLLTDPIFSRKLAELLSNDRHFSMDDVTLLSVGRHFRINAAKLVLGRNKEENETLRSLWSPPYVLIDPVEFKGPRGMLKGAPDNALLGVVAHIIASYGKHEAPSVELEMHDGQTTRRVVQRADVDIERYRIKEAE